MAKECSFAGAGIENRSPLRSKGSQKKREDRLVLSFVFNKSQLEHTRAYCFAKIEMPLINGLSANMIQLYLHQSKAQTNHSLDFVS